MSKYIKLASCWAGSKNGKKYLSVSWDTDKYLPEAFKEMAELRMVIFPVDEKYKKENGPTHSLFITDEELDKINAEKDIGQNDDKTPSEAEDDDIPF